MSDAIRADVEKTKSLLAACRWMLTPPPWKVFKWPDANLYAVTNDAGDSREEFDVFEAPDRSVAEMVAAVPTLLPSLAGHCEALLARVAELEAENARLREALDLAACAADGEAERWEGDGNTTAALSHRLVAAAIRKFAGGSWAGSEVQAPA